MSERTDVGQQTAETARRAAEQETAGRTEQTSQVAGQFAMEAAQVVLPSQ